MDFFRSLDLVGWFYLLAAVGVAYWYCDPPIRAIVRRRRMAQELRAADTCTTPLPRRRASLDPFVSPRPHSLPAVHRMRHRDTGVEVVVTVEYDDDTSSLQDDLASRLIH